MQVRANIPKIKWGTEQLFNEFQTVSKANPLSYEDGLFQSENSFQSSLFHWNDNMVSCDFFFKSNNIKNWTKELFTVFHQSSTYWAPTMCKPGGTDSGGPGLSLVSEKSLTGSSRHHSIWINASGPCGQFRSRSFYIIGAVLQHNIMCPTDDSLLINRTTLYSLTTT